MNSTYLLAALDDTINSVSVTLETNGPKYTYITRDRFEIGDLVVIPVRDGFAIRKVVKFDSPARVEQHASFEYKWAVQKVDLLNWERLNEITNEVNLKIEDIQRSKAREEMIQNLKDHLGDANLSDITEMISDTKALDVGSEVVNKDEKAND